MFIADCHYLAHFLETVTRDLPKAATVFRKTCDDHQYGPSCQKFASLVRRGAAGSDATLSFDYDRKACDFGEPKSCFNAAMSIVLPGVNKRLQVQPDVSLAVKLLERGCDLGCDNSCYLAGGLYLVGVPGVLDKNVSTTYKYDFKACQLGNKLACANLSGALSVESLADSHEADDPISNGFLIRLMQLKISNERSRERYGALQAVR